jgi:hypothetical protein
MSDVLNERWYAHPDDLVGGWCVMNRDFPPSRLNRHTDPDGREVGNFLSEAIARHVVELHNAHGLDVQRWRSGIRAEPHHAVARQRTDEEQAALTPKLVHLADGEGPASVVEVFGAGFAARINATGMPR